MKLFGTDGVRGEAGVKLDAFCALKLGIAAGIYYREHAKTNRILVGKDTRRSGYMLENALVSGLTAVGYEVIQIGPMPTPAIAYLTEDMRCDGGIMVSASHNPFMDNGIKFFGRSGYKIDEKDEGEIERIYKDLNMLETAQKRGKEIGSSKRIDDVVGRYIVHIKNSFPKDLSLYGIRVVLDCANGAAYKVAPTIFSELGAEVFVINDEPNGFNINENCGATQPLMLQEEVRRVRADIGFALDGDADRLVVVDEKGEVIHGDKLIGVLALAAKESKMLKNNAVVATIMSNYALEEFLKSHGIALVRSNVGDKYVLEAMLDKNLNFGGEQSGHIIFSDFAKTGDGLVSALQTMAYILKSKKPASKALNCFNLYPQILKNLSVNSKPSLESLENYQNFLKSIEAHNIRHLIRYSGTENKLRILLEGKDVKLLDKVMLECEEYFKGKIC
ncbi:phosphoglucosamine mutase [Helicobacter winghamensis]|uniref:Phosphoglucosamine mutase n=1 Tax=Helicobacter winghamensis TaxID=157268 RepID=A0A2N3PHU5_9HELI|nr:phosphoglucosamine mutase [Helicobacter winghamensis]EEO25576.1 phosphoglucosamine mutase [Helicobacter winghamensis ATCC BAA-430]PKT78014.1 phosphoglucosamine mutase [Helicobacter winghamensis]PKT78277.1 phosphoglucosamine mutase [Helicobacter winghamensis]PKT78542.1 phosphoglucosamine mutase [Helicobacter winghamensis]PKT80129.1 phosphoglucosamine mutase [Helicobacter winghamensis]